mmetsp:Transcript_3722/g.5446  ORF Transcript_3722/g.5446 Transcript_3722/m.5446 type:complete len:117 (-) Transcript_3722:563-913(-)
MNNMKFSVIKKAAAMSSDSESVHALPEGFTLAARILTDHDTGLLYIVPLSLPPDLQILFLECSAIGSTMEPIEIKHGTNPNAWPNSIYDYFVDLHERVIAVDVIALLLLWPWVVWL